MKNDDDRHSLNEDEGVIEIEPLELEVYAD